VLLMKCANVTVWNNELAPVHNGTDQPNVQTFKISYTQKLDDHPCVC